MTSEGGAVGSSDSDDPVLPWGPVGKAPASPWLEVSTERLEALKRRGRVESRLTVTRRRELGEIAVVESSARVRELLAACVRELEAIEMECRSDRVGHDELPGHADLNELTMMVFAARLECGRVAEVLATRTRDGTPADVLEICQRAGRRMDRGLTAVLVELDRLTGRDSPARRQEHEEDLAAALAVRRQYHRYWSELDLGIAAASTGPAKLEAAALALEGLLACRAFDEVRLGDKRIFWSLQDRIQNWRNGGRRDDQVGPLLSDLTASSSVLRHINLRQTLFDYDRRAVDFLVGELEGGGLSLDRPDHRAALLGLLGRDPQLDTIISAIQEEGDECNPAIDQLDTILMQLQASLSRV